MAEASLREHLVTRPWTVRVLAGMALAGQVYSLAASPYAISLATVVFTALSLLLLRMLWEGREGVWWFFVIVTAAGTATSVGEALDEPAAAVGLVACAGALLLLVSEPTRSFVRQRTDARLLG